MVIRKSRRSKRLAVKPKVRTYRKKALRKPKLKRQSTGSASIWGQRAFTAGCQAASKNVSPEEALSTEVTDAHKKVNACWNSWYHSVKGLPWHLYHSAASKFIEGYCHLTGWPADKWILVPTVQKVSAIVSVMNERETILSIIDQLHRLPLHEIIFVVNGSTDESFEIIRNRTQAMIVHFHEPLGHDVGRAIGAKLAESEILLFLDGDFPIFAEHLVPFIEATAQGMDIALNNISPYIEQFSNRDDVTIVKEFLNQSMARGDLGANSLTAVPHAMKGEAALQIGYANLAVPPKAQVIAIHKGLKVGSPASVDVITRNRIRASNAGKNNRVSDLIIGDHIEALKIVLELKGSRLSFPDQIRRRQLI